jgi:phosphatidylglycerophosphate synthase
LSRWLVAKKVSADFLSWVSVGMAFIGSVFLAKDFFLPALILLVISGILDALDGAVARHSQTASAQGVVLDSTLDRYSDSFVFGGLAYYYRFSPLLFLCSLASLLGAYMMSYSTAKAEAISVEPPTQKMKREHRWFCLMVGMLLSIILDAIYRENRLVVKIKMPMALAIVWIAVVANYSAFVRLREVWRKVSNRSN